MDTQNKWITDRYKLQVRPHFFIYWITVHLEESAENRKKIEYEPKLYKIVLLYKHQFYQMHVNQFGGDF